MIDEGAPHPAEPRVSSQPGHDDEHHPAVGHALVHDVQRRALWIALVLNGGFLVAEVVGGIAFNSLALLADAAHMGADVLGLVAALIAQTLMTRPPTRRHSWGLTRAEVLGAQFNALLLVAVSLWVIYEAVARLREPQAVAGAGLLVIATLGLGVNVISALVLRRAQGSSLNLRGAFLHMASDAAGSLAAIAAGVAVLAWDATWVDPAASIVIALLVLGATWGLLRDTLTVLLEAAPSDLDPAEIEAAIAALPDVEAVHHLHVWSVASHEPALSAHVVLAGELSLHDAQRRGDDLKRVLADRYGIEHATLELECHPCAEPNRSHHSPTADAG